MKRNAVATALKCVILTLSIIVVRGTLIGEVYTPWMSPVEKVNLRIDHIIEYLNDSGYSLKDPGSPEKWILERPIVPGNYSDDFKQHRNYTSLSENNPFIIALTEKILSIHAMTSERNKTSEFYPCVNVVNEIEADLLNERRAILDKILKMEVELKKQGIVNNATIKNLTREWLKLEYRIDCIYQMTSASNDSLKGYDESNVTKSQDKFEENATTTILTTSKTIVHNETSSTTNSGLLSAINSTFKIFNQTVQTFATNHHDFAHEQNATFNNDRFTRKNGTTTFSTTIAHSSTTPKSGSFSTSIVDYETSVPTSILLSVDSLKGYDESNVTKSQDKYEEKATTTILTTSKTIVHNETSSTTNSDLLSAINSTFKIFNQTTFATIHHDFAHEQNATFNNDNDRFTRKNGTTTFSTTIAHSSTTPKSTSFPTSIVEYETSVPTSILLSALKKIETTSSKFSEAIQKTLKTPESENLTSKDQKIIQSTKNTTVATSSPSKTNEFITTTKLPLSSPQFSGSTELFVEIYINVTTSENHTVSWYQSTINASNITEIPTENSTPVSVMTSDEEMFSENASTPSFSMKSSTVWYFNFTEINSTLGTSNESSSILEPSYYSSINNTDNNNNTLESYDTPVKTTPISTTIKSTNSTTKSTTTKITTTSLSKSSEILATESTKSSANKTAPATGITVNSINLEHSKLVTLNETQFAEETTTEINRNLETTAVDKIKTTSEKPIEKSSEMPKVGDEINSSVDFKERDILAVSTEFITQNHSETTIFPGTTNPIPVPPKTTSRSKMEATSNLSSLSSHAEVNHKKLSSTESSGFSTAKNETYTEITEETTSEEGKELKKSTNLGIQTSVYDVTSENESQLQKIKSTQQMLNDETHPTETIIEFNSSFEAPSAVEKKLTLTSSSNIQLNSITHPSIDVRHSNITSIHRISMQSFPKSIIGNVEVLTAPNPFVNPHTSKSRVTPISHSTSVENSGIEMSTETTQGSSKSSEFYGSITSYEYLTSKGSFSEIEHHTKIASESRKDDEIAAATSIITSELPVNQSDKFTSQSQYFTIKTEGIVTEYTVLDDVDALFNKNTTQSSIKIVDDKNTSDSKKPKSPTKSMPPTEAKSNLGTTMNISLMTHPSTIDLSPMDTKVSLEMALNKTESTVDFSVSDKISDQSNGPTLTGPSLSTALIYVEPHVPEEMATEFSALDVVETSEDTNKMQSQVTHDYFEVASERQTSTTKFLQPESETFDGLEFTPSQKIQSKKNYGTTGKRGDNETNSDEPQDKTQTIDVNSSERTKGTSPPKLTESTTFDRPLAIMNSEPSRDIGHVTQPFSSSKSNKYTFHHDSKSLSVTEVHESQFADVTERIVGSKSTEINNPKSTLNTFLNEDTTMNSKEKTSVPDFQHSSSKNDLKQTLLNYWVTEALTEDSHIKHSTTQLILEHNSEITNQIITEERAISITPVYIRKLDVTISQPKKTVKLIMTESNKNELFDEISTKKIYSTDGNKLAATDLETSSTEIQPKDSTDFRTSGIKEDEIVALSAIETILYLKEFGWSLLDSGIIRIWIMHDIPVSTDEFYKNSLNGSILEENNFLFKVLQNKIKYFHETRANQTENIEFICEKIINETVADLINASLNLLDQILEMAVELKQWRNDGYCQNYFQICSDFEKDLRNLTRQWLSLAPRIDCSYQKSKNFTEISNKEIYPTVANQLTTRDINSPSTEFLSKTSADFGATTSSQDEFLNHISTRKTNPTVGNQFGTRYITGEIRTNNPNFPFNAGLSHLESIKFTTGMRIESDKMTDETRKDSQARDILNVTEQEEIVGTTLKQVNFTISDRIPDFTTAEGAKNIHASTSKSNAHETIIGNGSDSLVQDILSVTLQAKVASETYNPVKSSNLDVISDFTTPARKENTPAPSFHSDETQKSPTNQDFATRKTKITEPDSHEVNAEASKESTQDVTIENKPIEKEYYFTEMDSNQPETSSKPEMHEKSTEYSNTQDSYNTTLLEEKTTTLNVSAHFTPVTGNLDEGNETASNSSEMMQKWGFEFDNKIEPPIDRAELKKRIDELLAKQKARNTGGTGASPTVELTLLEELAVNPTRPVKDPEPESFIPENFTRMEEIAVQTMQPMGTISVLIGLGIMTFLLMFVFRAKTPEAQLLCYHNFSLFMAFVFVTFMREPKLMASFLPTMMCSISSLLIHYFYLSAQTFATLLSVQCMFIHGHCTTKGWIMNKYTNIWLGFCELLPVLRFNQETGLPFMLVLANFLVMYDEYTTEWSCMGNMGGWLAPIIVLPSLSLAAVSLIVSESAFIWNRELSPLPLCNGTNLRRSGYGAFYLQVNIPLILASQILCHFAVYLKDMALYSTIFGLNIASACLIVYCQIMLEDRVRAFAWKYWNRFTNAIGWSKEGSKGKEGSKAKEGPKLRRGKNS